MKCVICESLNLDLFENYSGFKRVTSDAKLWPEGGKLSVCTNCSVIQKVLDSYWLTEIKQIYHNYEIFYQSDGEEQAIFNQATGRLEKRSNVLVTYLQNTGKLNQQSARILDYGCGNGEFLASFSSSFSKWKLYGFDLDNKYEKKLSNIAKFEELFHVGKNPAHKFELISLVHTLEHITQPIEVLRKLGSLLTEDGFLLVQVPNIDLNPFDILITDHLLHLAPENCRYILQKAGFEIIDISTNCITKEITILAKRNQSKICQEYDDNGLLKNKKLILQHIAFLQDILKDCYNLKKTNKSFGIFGTSICATWLYNYFANDIALFVDEDPNRIGKTHFSKPICSPKELEKNIPIYIPLPSVVAQNILSRYPDKDNLFHLSTKYQSKAC